MIMKIESDDVRMPLLANMLEICALNMMIFDERSRDDFYSRERRRGYEHRARSYEEMIVAFDLTQLRKGL